MNSLPFRDAGVILLAALMLFGVEIWAVPNWGAMKELFFLTIAACIFIVMLSKRPLSSKDLSKVQKDQTEAPGSPSSAPAFTSIGFDNQADELSEQLLPTERCQMLVEKIARDIKQKILQVFPDAEVVGFASGEISESAAHSVAVPEVDIVVKLPQDILLRNVQSTTSKPIFTGKVDDRKLHMTAIRICTDLLAPAGFSLRRSAFKGKDPKATLLAPQSADDVSCIPMDFSVNGATPLCNSVLIAACARVDPRAHMLILFVKRWAKNREICNAAKGHLMPYAWTLLCIHFLQGGLEGGSLLPSFKQLRLTPSQETTEIAGLDECMQGWKPPSPGSALSQKRLSQLFKDFIRFYLIEIEAVCMNWEATIEDPFRPIENMTEVLTGSGFTRLKEELARAQACFDSNASLTELLTKWVPPPPPPVPADACDDEFDDPEPAPTSMTRNALHTKAAPVVHKASTVAIACHPDAKKASAPANAARCQAVSPASASTRQDESAAFWDEADELSKQLLPTEQCKLVVDEIVQGIKQTVTQVLPQADVVGFTHGEVSMGATSCGYAVPEVDIVVNLPQDILVRTLQAHTSKLKSTGKVDERRLHMSAIRKCLDLLVSNGGFTLRRSAFKERNPKVTLMAPHSLDGSGCIPVDFLVNAATPLCNSVLTTASARVDPRAHMLILLVRRFAKSRGISNASKGFLMPYAWTLLCIHFLQNGLEGGSILPPFKHLRLPPGQDTAEIAGLAECMQGWAPASPGSALSKMRLGQLFKDFIYFYSNKIEAVCASWEATIEDTLMPAKNLTEMLTGSGLSRMKEEFARAQACLDNNAPLSEILTRWVPPEQKSPPDSCDDDSEDAEPITPTDSMHVRASACT
mmetsp:Transcript_65966/g.114853  ORF Transcript_65966/g.114853 Transcript_65966/m.114853 type:complete len:864 (+) Transcript_65966:213-2804(+)